MKPWFALALLATLAGCSSSPSQLRPERQQSDACRTYRSMMTAPMAPDAMARLREAANSQAKAETLSAPGEAAIAVTHAGQGAIVAPC
ncbi:hypothetical protein [Pseudomonas sp. A014]|uniref:hypothetical protein n=1 Tax=Pseudomonas sp. A014 TaxID=3458058 RepID=UPI00403525B4